MYLNQTDPARIARLECEESQRWAEAARRRADAALRSRRRFARLRVAVMVLAALAIAWVAFAAPPADAHHGKRCHTRKCAERLWNRDHPFRSAVASVYDGVGLGGRVACLGRWPGGMVLAHKTLPCGTRLRVCYRRCTTARVWDRGPFVAGREFDLDVGVQRATGFPWGVATIRVRELPR